MKRQCNREFRLCITFCVIEQEINTRYLINTHITANFEVKNDKINQKPNADGCLQEIKGSKNMGRCGGFVFLLKGCLCPIY